MARAATERRNTPSPCPDPESPGSSGSAAVPLFGNVLYSRTVTSGEEEEESAEGGRPANPELTRQLQPGRRAEEQCLCHCVTHLLHQDLRAALGTARSELSHRHLSLGIFPCPWGWTLE